MQLWSYIVNTSVFVKLKLHYDRQSVGQSVSVSGPIWDPWPIFLSPWHFLCTVVGLLFCSALSDERTVCNLLLMLVLASAVPSGLSPAELKTIFYCPNSWDSPNLEGQVTVFISRNRVAQIYPRALGSLSVTSLSSSLSAIHNSTSWIKMFLYISSDWLRAG
jgi:hypothetical protein